MDTCLEVSHRIRGIIDAHKDLLNCIFALLDQKTTAQQAVSWSHTLSKTKALKGWQAVADQIVATKNAHRLRQWWEKIRVVEGELDREGPSEEHQKNYGPGTAARGNTFSTEISTA